MVLWLYFSEPISCSGHKELMLTDTQALPITAQSDMEWRLVRSSSHVDPVGRFRR